MSTVQRNTFNRRNFLMNTLAGSAFLANRGFSQPAKPNIIIFYADDLGYGDISCYGADDIYTPYIDALAAGGTRFEQWYSNSPLCSPSRASLLTGRYPQRTGLASNAHRGLNDTGMNPRETTLAEMLKPAGYRTGICGKWHQGSTSDSRPNAQGFDSFYGFLSGCVDYYSHIMYWGQGPDNFPYHDLWRNDDEIWENGEYMTHRITEESVQFIRQNKSEQPFFLYVPYSAPHYPMHAPQEYIDRFKHIDDPQRRIHAAMVSAMDDGIGAVTRELERQGLMENTLILFLSDNGPSIEQRNLLDDSNRSYHGGSSGGLRGYKGSVFEGGIRVPAIFHWKDRIPAGKVSNDVCMTMDVFPTLAKYAGRELPGDLAVDGRDIRMSLDVLDVRSAPDSRTLFWAMGNQRAARRGNFKLVLDGKLDFQLDSDDKVFLCDLKDDPFEKANLNDKHPNLVESLTSEIRQWEKNVGLVN